jgi:hypothetical protein
MAVQKAKPAPNLPQKRKEAEEAPELDAAAEPATRQKRV